MMIVIDIVSFWRWLMVSNCVLESMLAPRNHFATDIPYLKAMARLRVLVSQKALRIIATLIGINYFYWVIDIYVILAFVIIYN